MSQPPIPPFQGFVAALPCCFRPVLNSLARAAGHEPIPVAPVPPKVRKSRSARH